MGRAGAGAPAAIQVLRKPHTELQEWAWGWHTKEAQRCEQVWGPRATSLPMRPGGTLVGRRMQSPFQMGWGRPREQR